MTMTSTFMARSTLCGALLSLALAGCGGGGSGSTPATETPSAGTPVSPSPAASSPEGSAGTGSPAASASVVTLPSYVALRQASNTAPATPAADVSAGLLAANQHAAVEHLNQVLPGNDNVAVVPPLTLAVLRSLGAAASGNSLAEIGKLFDLAPTPYASLQQTGHVTSQWWAERGQRFGTGFLSAIDTPKLGSPPATSSFAETGFGDGTAGSDSAFMQGLMAASADLSINAFDTPANIRLLALHSLNAKTAWTAVQPFDGVFERGADDMLRLPMVRVSNGVVRHVGTDFTADLLPAGDYALLTLRPAPGTLDAFASTRLESALAESVQALMSVGATPAAGDMVLPLMNSKLPFRADGPLRLAGVNQVYDEINADLRNLDGVGGTYVQTASPASVLQIAADGLTMHAAQATAFTFSPRNVNGPTYGSGVTNVTFPSYFCFGTCVWPTPDLRSFFIAVLDARGWVVSLVAIRKLDGTAVTPTFTP